LRDSIDTMSDKGRRGALAAWFLPAVAAVVVGAVVVRHVWPNLIAADDIAILGAGLTLAATGLAFRAAGESRDAATESRRALQLHFRPGNVHVEFTVRDPADPAASMLYVPVPSPAPLWVGLTFHEEAQAEYQLEWIDSNGRAHTRQVVPTGQVQFLLLEGIDAEEDNSSGAIRQIVAALPHLSLHCQDRLLGTTWRTSKSWPTATVLGSYELTFQPSN